MRFKNAYELLNRELLNFQRSKWNRIFQCTENICCGEFQMYPLRFHTNILSIHWKMWSLMRSENLRAPKFKSSYTFSWSWSDQANNLVYAAYVEMWYVQNCYPFVLLRSRFQQKQLSRISIMSSLILYGMRVQDRKPCWLKIRLLWYRTSETGSDWNQIDFKLSRCTIS